MGKKVSEKIEYLRKLLENEAELIQQSKGKQDEIEKLKLEKKEKPELKKELIENKKQYLEIQQELKNVKQEIRWFTSQLGGKSSIKWTALITISLIMFILGIAVGAIFLDGLFGFHFKKKSVVENLIMCEFVYGGQPANPNTVFEVGKTKTLTCYAVISPKSERMDYFIEWMKDGAVMGSTPLLVKPGGGPVFAQRDFSLEDLGKWEAHLKTRDGVTWAMTEFSLVYPKIELKQAVVCEDIINERPHATATLFLAKDRTLYCFVESKSNERYAELVHEWFFEDKLISKFNIPLSSPISYKWSQLNIKKNQTGAWHINVLSGEGKILNRLEFRIEDRKITIPYAEFYAKNENGKPDSVLTKFLANKNPIHFFTRVMSNFSDFKVKHQWYYDNKKRKEKIFDIDSLGAMISSSMIIPKNRTGKWTLKVTDAKDNVLFEKEINVEKPITDLVGINRLVFCRTVFDKDPYDISSKFKIGYNTKIWAHATVNNKKGLTEITYKWFYKGQLIKTNTIKNISKSTSYRTYDYKTIMPHQKGRWNVNIYAEDGSLLKKGSFVVE